MQLSPYIPVNAVQSMHSSQCTSVDALQSMQLSRRSLVDAIWLDESR